MFESSNHTSKFKWVVTIGYLSGLLVLIYLTKDMPKDAVSLSTLFENQANLQNISQGAAKLYFVIGYAILALALFPGSVLSILGGFLFGFYWGLILNLLGATICAICSFSLIRYLGWRPKFITQNTKARSFLNSTNITWTLVVLRLVPLVPFNVINYAFGLTRMRTFHFAWISFITMIPGGIAYTLVGVSIKIGVRREAFPFVETFAVISCFLGLFLFSRWAKKRKMI